MDDKSQAEGKKIVDTFSVLFLAFVVLIESEHALWIYVTSNSSKAIPRRHYSTKI